ncbi:MAG: hypothetical protein JWN98_2425 [Abditibacteriota bacterium]|nr:hypothetical protein [Abditibacteriota bacterium]
MARRLNQFILLLITAAIPGVGTAQPARGPRPGKDNGRTGNVHGAISGRGVLRLRETAALTQALKGQGLKERRRGRVRILGHSLVDEGGPFLGLGVSYFTALWRCKNDRERLKSDLAFLSSQGFNYYRMLSMVGYYPAWEGIEIAPTAFTSRNGKRVDAWPDYWAQLRQLVDMAYDQYQMRTQITIFADAQLMPDKQARRDHIHKLLREVVAGREHKIILLEIANEAWQNGFSGHQGTADLREFTKYIGDRTSIPIAITSNHENPIADVYAGSAADIATWHFSRDRKRDGGWNPVYDCWDVGDLPGLPPVSSNEPIGPGSSVNSESEPIRLLAAPAFAYIARLPMYVFHSDAGVFGKTRFQEVPGIERFGHLLTLLPRDLANWQRNDGKEPTAPFTTFAGEQPNRYWPEAEAASDGCVRNTGSRSGDRFICLPIGIRPAGLRLQARHSMQISVYDVLTGKVILSATKRAGEELKLPQGPGALLIIGRALASRTSGGARG